jgi:hypothetical protein
MIIDMHTRKRVTAMAGNERCIHELIRQHCGYCRVPPIPLFVEPLFDTTANEDPDEYAPTRSLTAKYSGHCVRCDEYYGQGDRIYGTATYGDYLCSECGAT